MCDNVVAQQKQHSQRSAIENITFLGRLFEIVTTHPEVVSLDEDLGHDNVRITFRRRRRLRHRRHPVDELELYWDSSRKFGNCCVCTKS